MVDPTFSINLRLPFELVKEIDEFLKKSGERTKFLTKLIQIGFTVVQNKDNIANPQFIETLIENIESDKIDNFFDNMQPKQLEALYVFARSEMEKRYGKERLDKFC
jgi:hypothetical protein